MKKKYLVTIYSIAIFVFIVLYLSLNKNNVYTTQENIGKKISVIQLNYFDKPGEFNIQEISNFNFTLLNFWASWCGPCRKEHKHLVELSKNSNLKIIGVNFKDDKKNAMEFLKEMGNPFFILTKDPEGKKSVNFGIYGIPETILINKDLKILKKYVGALSDKDVREIQRIVKK
tara:strand:+ start:984 stop:1502 length:519 start_codon:yes stop_codon:yes gene_type:complete